MVVNKERWSRNSIKKFISTENPNFAVHMKVPAGLPLNLWPRDSRALRVPSHPAVSALNSGRLLRSPATRLTEKTASKTGLPCPCASPELTNLLCSLRRQHCPPVAMGELRAALKPAHPPVPWTQHAASALGVIPTHFYCRVLWIHKEQLLRRENRCQV